MERIGIMGGSFNPIHLSHVHMADVAQKSANLTNVLFIPSGNPPHKVIQEATPLERAQMCVAATGRTKSFVLSQIEIEREGIIYSVDTLMLLKKQYPNAQLFYIIGEDTLFELTRWYKYQKVFRLCTFLVIRRLNTEGDFENQLNALRALGAKIKTLASPPNSISSTSVRNDLSNGILPTSLSDAVQAYIALKGLYTYPSKWLNNASPMLNKLFSTLSPMRFSHSLSVCYYARKLANLHQVDSGKATLAALLHDCAKCLPEKRMREIALKQHLTNDETILASSALLHSLAGKWLAQTEYGISDKDVLNAIAYHTLGSPTMTKLDMVVYLADKLELGRKPYEGLTTLRELAQSNLREAVIATLENTIEHLKKDGLAIHPAIYETLCTLKEETMWN